VAAGAAFLVAATLLFSWGGRNWSAIPDLLRAGPHWADRATGQGHEKPCWYYFTLLGGGYSGLVFLALAVAGLAGCIAAVARRKASSPELYLSWYAISITVIYSAIPYKTPWLALNLWLPLAFLAGIAGARLWAGFRLRLRLCLLTPAAAAFTLLLALDVRARVFQAPAGERNPYAYAHTVEDLLRLPDRLRQLAAQEGLSQPRIAVVASDPWPLPWYLRTFSQVGFWQPGQDPGAADFFITSPAAAAMLPGSLNDRRPEYFGVRPEVILILWARGKPEIPHD
jgi:predicted membrane-bound mannosyltransferase